MSIDKVQVKDNGSFDILSSGCCNFLFRLLYIYNIALNKNKVPPLNIVPHEVWDSVRSDKIWSDSVRFGKDMARFGEIHWNLVRYGKILRDIGRYG